MDAPLTSPKTAKALGIQRSLPQVKAATLLHALTAGVAAAFTCGALVAYWPNAIGPAALAGGILGFGLALRPRTTRPSYLENHPRG